MAAPEDSLLGYDPLLDLQEAADVEFADVLIPASPFSSGFSDTLSLHPVPWDDLPPMRSPTPPDVYAHERFEDFVLERTHSAFSGEQYRRLELRVLNLEEELRCLKRELQRSTKAEQQTQGTRRSKRPRRPPRRHKTQ